MDKYFRLSRKEQLVVQFILLTWACIVILPIAIAIINSLEPNLGEVYRNPMALPSVWSFANDTEAWVGANFSSYFLNSVIIAVSTVLLVTFCASSTAYVLVRMNFILDCRVFAESAWTEPGNKSWSRFEVVSSGLLRG